MLTPKFEVSQNDQFIIIAIKVPYGKVADMEIYAKDTEFLFHMHPYFLRLNLPGSVVEDSRQSAAYDIDQGTCTINLPKVNEGEHFESLDLLTTLLAQPKQQKYKPSLIEVINSADEDSKEIDVDDFDWQLEQKLADNDTDSRNELFSQKYGFANRYNGVFSCLQENLFDIIDVPEPERMTAAERSTERIAAEDEYFNEDHYLADFMENEQIKQLIAFITPWQEACDIIDSTYDKNKDEVDIDYSAKWNLFSDEEKQQLRELPNKEYLLDKLEDYQLLLGLIDIIFAYAYNYRTTEGENTVESAWTICKISSSLSWLEVFKRFQSVLIACCRRALCYPLYRNWDLIQVILKDVTTIFRLGKRYILKCLLEIRQILKNHENKYILNDVYITDYCVWIQKLSNAKIRFISKKLNQATITKSATGWDIELLEYAALTVRDNYSDHSSESVLSEDSSEESSDCDSTDNESSLDGLSNEEDR
ncbi:Protein SHQ1-like protein [Trichoplax sp. H2]|nr:Protein SHQ1-like protein [Trichoplax sp. H2]|eukprot:RDD43192.1 Protein SHQ1-like protein [Trichoplax sp. H2]